VFLVRRASGLRGLRGNPFEFFVVTNMRAPIVTSIVLVAAAASGAGYHIRHDDKGNLQELSKKTGGAYFEVGEKETLDQICATIEEELRSQYSLGYTPDPNAQNGYRRIKVGVQRKGMVVRGREGYYPHPR
jgi:VWFA-related protein